MEEKEVTRDYLTTREVCELFKISLTTLNKRIKDDGIPYLQVGTTKRFLKSDIDDWVSRNTINHSTKK